MAKAAVELVGAEEFDASMPTKFSQLQDAHDEVKPEFQVTDCKKCRTRKTAFSWDIDLASMVNKLGEPYKGQYLLAYLMPTLQAHATLASAFSRDGVGESYEQRRVHDAEMALIGATLVFVLVIQSQSEIFALGLDSEISACWEEVTTVWKDRSHGPLAQ